MEREIDEFAAALQPPGVSAFTPDGRSTSSRDGMPDAMARNADRIRRLIRAENGGRELQVPYAHGTGRATPRATVIRREILAEILADDPTVTVPRILGTYDYSDRTPGGRLRHQLRQRLEAEGCPIPGKLSQSALYGDFAFFCTAHTHDQDRKRLQLNARVTSRGGARIHPQERRHLALSFHGD